MSTWVNFCLKRYENITNQICILLNIRRKIKINDANLIGLNALLYLIYFFQVQLLSVSIILYCIILNFFFLKKKFLILYSFFNSLSCAAKEYFKLFDKQAQNS